MAASRVGSRGSLSRGITLHLEPLERRLLLSAGALDPTFGVGGLVTTDFGSTVDNPSGIAIEADGQIVVVGTSVQLGTGRDFVLARYNSSDGSLDTSFSGDGLVTTDFGGPYDYCQDVAIQSDGKIVVVGSSQQPGTGNDFALARYNADGALDTTFGSGGLVTTDFAGYSDGALSVVIQADGKILVAGNTYQSGTGYDFALVRYNSDGSLDTSFGTGGKVTTDFAGYSDAVGGMAIQSDGKIVVAGASSNGSTTDFALVRYNVDGTLDDGGPADSTPGDSFGTGGKVTTDFVGFNDTVADVAIQSDGRIVVTGGSIQSSAGYAAEDFALARYNSDGSLDASFGAGGKVTTDFGGFQDLGADLAVQPDGRIVVAGISDQSGAGFHGWDFALARYNSDGSLDTSFDGNGKVTTDVGGDAEAAAGVAIQTDGRIVVAGFSVQGGTVQDEFALARYIGVSDTTPPVVAGADVGGDLQSLTVQLNDDDLDVARATDSANYVLTAANGDADGDGDAFNDGDELQVAIASVTYNSSTDEITIQVDGVLFDDYYRLEMDGDDDSGDATLGVTDLAGNYLGGGDFVADLDLTALSAVEDLLDELEAMGLSTGAESSLAGRLEAIVKLLDQDVGSERSLTALLDAFIKGVNQWWEKNEITTENRDILTAEAELIQFGISLTSP